MPDNQPTQSTEKPKQKQSPFVRIIIVLIIVNIIVLGVAGVILFFSRLNPGPVIEAEIETTPTVEVTGSGGTGSF